MKAPARSRYLAAIGLGTVAALALFLVALLSQDPVLQPIPWVIGGLALAAAAVATRPRRGFRALTIAPVAAGLGAAGLVLLTAVVVLEVRASLTSTCADQLAEWRVYRVEARVAVFREGSGPLTGSAVSPPGSRPTDHPFVTGHVSDPIREDELRRVLEASRSFEEFVAHLRTTGYVPRRVCR